MRNEVSVDAGTRATLPTTGVAAARTASVTGPANGASHTVAVRAVNAADASTPVETTVVLPAVLPGAPTGAVSVAGGQRRADLRAARLPRGQPGDPLRRVVDGGTTWSTLVVTGSWSTRSAALTGRPTDVRIRSLSARSRPPARERRAARCRSRRSRSSRSATTSSVLPGSFLGTQVGERVQVAGGVSQAYQGGLLYFSAATGVHEVHGSILGRYLEVDGPAGPLGFPTTDESVTPDKVGRYNRFSGSGGASITSSPAAGPYAVHAAIHAQWLALGAERSRLGYSTRDEYAIPGGRRSDVLGGWIADDFATARLTVTFTR